MNRLILTLILLGAAGALMAAGDGVPAYAMEYVNLWIRAYKIDSTQQASIGAIAKAWQQYGDGDPRKLTYILALSYHESRLRPIKEIRATSGPVKDIQDRYWSTGYYGRGFVQLTWEDNYRKMSPVVGIDLVANPDAALRPDVAAKILVYGMMNGSFTGKRLGDYINASKADYYNARRTVGAIMVAGQDTAALIVGHLQKVHNA